MFPVQFAKKHNLIVSVTGNKNSQEIQGVYCGDLLSLAMVRAKKGDAFVTVMANTNAIAAAVLAGAGCVILCEGFHFDKEALDRAREHDLCVLETEASVFTVAVWLAVDLGLCQ